MPDRRTCALACCLLLLAGCGVVDDLGARRKQPEAPPQSDPRDAAMVAHHLQTLEAIARGTPAHQAELAAEVRLAAEADPTLFNRLRLALVQGLPGHAASNPEAARDALGELLATPEMLRPAELAIAHVMLHEVNARIALAGENLRTAADSERDESLRVEALNRRIQAQTTENARLQKELAEALKKLEAVATLERNIAERRNGAERTP
ncbi:MAG: hypothetical protein ACT4UP_05385 [Gammaproteobacteria bacterium]